ncbi:MAG: D-alanyl-D-alanine carboxypeptidase family protein [Clostridia bacterium]|nr:D-alanyl-D-alanine carboxypeptidase family protein [Clostridia bacterium]
MINKTTLNNFITFLLIFTVLFSINCVEIFAEPAVNDVQNVEGTAETTTEAPSDVKNYADENVTLDLNSRAAILIDANTGTIIYEKNAHEKHYPASITKVLTGYIACSEGNLEDTLTVSQNAIDGMGIGGSSIGLVPGEQVSFLDGMYGVMLESANEVCMAIAEHMSGSEDAFVAKMNEVAKSLGCNESNFANPHGFHNENHYTTCYDMALITKKAVTNEDFNHIWGTISHQIPATNLNVARYLNHKDKMIKPNSEYYYPDLLGGKTCFTDEAGNTLVSYAERNGASLISVVMKADGYDNTYKDSIALLDYGFSVYNSRETIFKAADYSYTAKVVQNYRDKTYELGTVSIGAARDVYMALPKFMTADTITVKADFEENLTAPIGINDIVGTINIYYNDTLLDSVDAIATSNAPALSDKELAKRELKENLRKYVMIPLMVLIIIFLLFLIVIFIQSVMNKITGKSRKKSRRPKKKRNNSSAKRKPKKRKRPSSSNNRSQRQH